MRRLLAALAVVAAWPVFAADSGPHDWPQWRGPDRTGLSKETGLLKTWPTDGPKQSWKIAGLGDGYSTPSVSAGRIYLLGAKENDEHLICLEEKDGTRVWTVKIGQKARVNYPGPRSTPTVDAGFAYAVTSEGNLACVAIDKGEVKWQKHYRKDFTGNHGSWAYAESPLVDGDLVIGTPGAEKAAVVAFRKQTGDVVWKTDVTGVKRRAAAQPNGKGGRDRPYWTAGYSSPIIAVIGGVKQYVQFLDGGLVGVDAKTGKLLWHYEEPASTGANISTPIVRGDHVFAVSAYGTGAGQAKIVNSADGFKAEQQYFLNRFQNHHGGVVLVKNHLYGTTNTSLTCIDFETGKVAWEDRSVGKGSLTYADGQLYVRGEKGRIALVEANPSKYVENGAFDQPERSKQAAWPHPVVANGKLYIRDWDILFCYDVKGK